MDLRRLRRTTAALRADKSKGLAREKILILYVERTYAPRVLMGSTFAAFGVITIRRGLDGFEINL